MATIPPEAQKLIDDLRARKSSGVWSRIDFPAIGNYERIACDLEARIKDPTLINQQQTNLCALAEFVYNWVSDDPVGYTKMVISLFETGRGWLSKSGVAAGKIIWASEDLKRQPLPGMFQTRNYIAFADWILLATLRERYNYIFGYGASEGIFNIRAWCYPGDVEKSFKAAGYTQVDNQTDWPNNQDMNNFLLARSRADQGWRVVLLIHMNMLNRATVDNWSASSDHFVTLLPNTTTISGDQMRFQVHTWGQNIWTASGDNMSEAAFEKNYYGHVAARF